MCGIAGIVDQENALALKTALARMLSAQIHRGPDDDGMWLQASAQGVVGLGSRRLAIRDRSPHGHQPMVNADTGDVLVFNGEIYNTPELARQLIGWGHCLRGRSDTEVVLRAYEQWGIGCLDKLRGMFALALWDARKKTLILARDPFGIKPLYHGRTQSGGFIFASEVRALLASAAIPDAIDRPALASYFAYGAVQEPMTIVAGVYMLPRGSWLEIGENGKTLHSSHYWHLPPPERAALERHPAELIDEGRALLDQSVRRHQLSDVPVGIFLSSGLDSTAIAALARRSDDSRVHTFTISFPDTPENDEAAIARDTAARLDTQHHEQRVDGSTALAWTRSALAAMDQPTMDGLNSYLVARAAHERGLTVALSGQGADELFGGYRLFRDIGRWQRQLSWLTPLPQSWRTKIVVAATTGQSRSYREKARDAAAAENRLENLYFNARRLLPNRDLVALGCDAATVGLPPNYQWNSEAALDSCSGDSIAAVCRLEAQFYLGNMLLRDTDVFGMANSLEIRVPFLDRDFAEWALRIPGDLLLPDQQPPKHMLRQMCREFYSLQQVTLPKRGFTPPFAQWMQGPLRSLVEDSCEAVSRSNLVDKRSVQRIKENFYREPGSSAWSRLWAIVAFGQWLVNFRDRRQTQSAKQVA